MASTHIQAPVVLPLRLVSMVTQLACNVVNRVACSDCLAACAYHTVLCCAVLCCAVLCYAVACCATATQDCEVQYFAVLTCAPKSDSIIPPD